MNNVTVYELDDQNLLLRTLDLDPLGQMPARSTLAAPPKTVGTQVAQCINDVWTVLSKRPEPLPAPAAPVPSSISPRQIRQALTRAGLRQQVEDSVAAGDQDLKDWWEFATEFLRDNPHVAMMAKQLGISDSQLDDLWRVGGAL